MTYLFGEKFFDDELNEDSVAYDPIAYSVVSLTNKAKELLKQDFKDVNEAINALIKSGYVVEARI